jgi:hypothetical protein
MGKGPEGRKAARSQVRHRSQAVEPARLRVARRVSRGEAESDAEGAGRLRVPGEDSKGRASSMEGDSTRRHPVGRTST